jgi:hypothetical protein
MSGDLDSVAGVKESLFWEEVGFLAKKALERVSLWPDMGKPNAMAHVPYQGIAAALTTHMGGSQVVKVLRGIPPYGCVSRSFVEGKALAGHKPFWCGRASLTLRTAAQA